MPGFWLILLLTIRRSGCLTSYSNFTSTSFTTNSSTGALSTTGTSNQTLISTSSLFSSQITLTPQVGALILLGLGITSSIPASIPSTTPSVVAINSSTSTYLIDQTNVIGSTLASATRTVPNNSISSIQTRNHTATISRPSYFSNRTTPVAQNGTVTITPGAGLPGFGSGPDFASQCNVAWASYELLLEDHSLWSSGLTPEAQPIPTQAALSGAQTLTLTTLVYPTYTLCDGNPRIIPGAGYSTVTYTSVDNFLLTSPIQPLTSIDWNHTTFVAPPCSISASDCVEISKTFELIRTNPSISASQWWYTPRCGIVNTDCNQCTISASSAQLIYFAVPTTISRDMCASEPTGAFQQPVQYLGNETNEIARVIVNGQTLFADKAYISFEGVHAEKGCGEAKIPVGKTVANGLLTLASSDVFSIRYPNFGEEYPFDFADLNKPVPWSAWYGLPWCYWGLCSTIVDPYEPTIAVPDQIRQLDPAWASCALDWQGTWDPPDAVTAVGGMPPMTAAEALSSPSSTTAPAPKSTPALGQAAQTTTPTISATTTTRPALQVFPVSTLQGSPTDTQSPDPVMSPALDMTLTIAGLQVLVIPSLQAVVAGTNRLTVGGPAATIGTVVLSVASEGLVVGSIGPISVLLPPSSTTITTSPLASALQAQSLTIVVTVAGQTYSVVAMTQTDGLFGPAVVRSSTLLLGGPAITLGSEIISFGSAGLVVDGQIMSFSAISPSTLSPTEQETVLTINGQALTVVIPTAQPDVILVNSETLSVGGTAVMVNGHTVSLAPGSLVVDGSFIPFAHVQTSATTSLSEQMVSYTSVSDSLSVEWETTYLFATSKAALQKSHLAENFSTELPLSNQSIVQTMNSLADFPQKASSTTASMDHASSSTGPPVSGGAFAETKSSNLYSAGSQTLDPTLYSTLLLVILLFAAI